ncbi:MAG: secondary thiamine-phosphate synthase enzyme YjbQ [Planctomycetota bacterium]|nr:secondary thiamine-phosphate synthase enzyme YjbQ [Planctomycetota bacterium]
MGLLQRELQVRTSGRGLVDLTAQIAAVVRASRVTTGTCVVFCRHTSASLLITENADPSARGDVLAWLERLAPDGDPRNAHDDEGPDDSPAHQRSAITRTSETIPVSGGELALGRWQGVFLVEQRLAGHARTIVVHVSGE